jgi:hypothetical protein
MKGDRVSSRGIFGILVHHDVHALAGAAAHDGAAQHFHFRMHDSLLQIEFPGRRCQLVAEFGMASGALALGVALEAGLLVLLMRHSFLQRVAGFFLRKVDVVLACSVIRIDWAS